MYAICLWLHISHFKHMNDSCITPDVDEYLCALCLLAVCNAWVTHMNESYHTYEWVIAHMNESWHTYEHSHGRVMSHIWMSHGTRMNASYMDESWHTHGWVILNNWMHMAHTWIRHVTHMNESWHTFECVMSHAWLSHVTHMHESCHTHVNG